VDSHFVSGPFGILHFANHEFSRTLIHSCSHQLDVYIIVYIIPTGGFHIIRAILHLKTYAFCCLVLQYGEVVTEAKQSHTLRWH
jgi:hypothetical protein